METQEFKIQVPEGYEIDRENSTFECIRFKKKTMSYQDVLKELGEPSMTTIFYSSTKHLYKIGAIEKLLFVAKYLNNGWVPDFKDSNECKYIIVEDFGNNNLDVINTKYYLGFRNGNIVCFKSKELAKQAIEILGEETIKQALDANY